MKVTDKDGFIWITDGIGPVEQRKLLEITKSLGRSLNREEFNEILAIYNRATERLLKEE